MTEEEWQVNCDPDRMLSYLNWRRGEHCQPPDVATSRRLRLFACACCRRVWRLIFITWQGVVEGAEKYADCTVGYDELRFLFRTVSEAWDDGTMAAEATGMSDQWLFKHASDAAGYASQAVGMEAAPEYPQQLETWQAAREGEELIQAAILRDIFGNPFHPVVFDAEWQSATAVGLAQSMYESRDFSPMPILADALEEAGCDNPDILAHCRAENGVHVRGCWVVDLVLGKA